MTSQGITLKDGSTLTHAQCAALASMAQDGDEFAELVASAEYNLQRGDVAKCIRWFWTHT